MKALRLLQWRTNEAPTLRLAKCDCMCVYCTWPRAVTCTPTEIQEQPQKQRLRPRLSCPTLVLWTDSPFKPLGNPHDVNRFSYLLWGRGSAEGTQPLLCGITAHRTEVTFIGNTHSRNITHGIEYYKPKQECTNQLHVRPVCCWAVLDRW